MKAYKEHLYATALNENRRLRTEAHIRNEIIEELERVNDLKVYPIRTEALQ